MNGTRKMFRIIGSGTAETVDHIKNILESSGMLVDIDLLEADFNEWIETLPTEPVEGFNQEATQWIRHWGIGGGDFSTEESIANCSPSNIPKEWANDAYNSFEGYSKNSFDAARLIMELVGEVLYDLRSNATPELVSCQPCKGTGRTDDDEKCDLCWGTGSVSEGEEEDQTRAFG